MRKPKPVNNWKQAYKMHSVQLMLALSVFNTLPLVWTAFLDKVSPVTWALINVILTFVAICARLVYQPKLEQPNGK